MKIQLDITTTNQQEAEEAVRNVADWIKFGEYGPRDVYVDGRVVGTFEILEEAAA